MNFAFLYIVYELFWYALVILYVTQNPAIHWPTTQTKYKLSIKKRRREKCENQWHTVETDPTSNRKLAIANTLLHDLSLSFLATGISIKSVLWNLLISSNFLKGYILKRLLKDINSLKWEILLMIKHLYSDIK